MSNNLYEGITVINYQNTDFPLNGAAVEDVLALLNITDNHEVARLGNALVITEKSGGKGAETPEELKARVASTFGNDKVEPDYKLQKNSEGIYVPIIHGFTADEVTILMNHNEINLTSEMSPEDIVLARSIIEEDKEAKINEELQSLRDKGIELYYDDLVKLKEILSNI